MFTKDSRTESFLGQMGVDFTYSNNVGVGLLTPKWNEDNLARPKPVNDDAVLEYAALMERGSAAPAPMLLDTDNGYRVLDGVQRVSAAQCVGCTRLSAYLIKTDSDDTVDAIRVLANARLQGRAEPYEWTRRRAVEVLVVQRGMAAAEVALMGGWSAKEVEKLAEVIRCGVILETYGVPKLSDRMLRELGPFLPDNIGPAKEPIVGFLNTLSQARLSAPDAKPFISEFFRPVSKASKAHTIYSQRLKAVHSDPEIEARRHGRASREIPKDVVLLRTLKTALTVAKDLVATGERVQNVEEFLHLLDTVRSVLVDGTNRRKRRNEK